MRRRSKRTRRIRLDAVSLPMVGLISIIFLMFSYYIVTHKPETENTFFDVALDSSDELLAPTNLFFTLDVRRVYLPDDESIYFLNGRPFYLKDLIPALKEISRMAPGMIAVINFSPDAKYQKLITLIDACTHSGIARVRLVCEKIQVAEKN